MIRSWRGKPGNMQEDVRRMHVSFLGEQSNGIYDRRRLISSGRSLHDSTPSMVAPMVSCLPIQAPSSFYTALDVIKALTHCTTARNPSFPRYSALAAKFEVSIGDGELVSASIALSKSGIDTENGLLHIPMEAGTRAFDALYYLLTSSSSPKEREQLNLKPYSSYELLKRSNTYSPPSYVPTADDAAAAEDFRTNLRAIGIKGKALRDFIMALTGLLKFGDTLDYFKSPEEIDEIADVVAELLDVPIAPIAKQVKDSTTEVFIAGVYESLVDWVIEHANNAISYEIRNGKTIGSDNGMGTADDGLFNSLQSKNYTCTVGLGGRNLCSKSVTRFYSMIQRVLNISCPLIR